MPGKSESGKPSKRLHVERRDEAEEVVEPMPLAKADAALAAVLRQLGIERSDLSKRDLFSHDTVRDGRALRSYSLHRDLLRRDS